MNDIFKLCNIVVKVCSYFIILLIFSKLSLLMPDQQQTRSVQINYFTLILIIIGIFLAIKIRGVRRRNPRGGLSTAIQQIPRDKVILAVEIWNLILQYSTRRKVDFTPVKPRAKDQGLLSSFIRWLGFGEYYRLMYTPSKIRQFLNDLKALPNTELFLYTSLNREFVQKIIKKLQLDEFFPQERRRYNLEYSDDALKHASEVDFNTRRVMIITATHDDHSSEDSKYFLVLHNRRNRWSSFLRSSSTMLKLFFENLEGVDHLHNQLMNLKIQIQSDAEFQ